MSHISAVRFVGVLCVSKEEEPAVVEHVGGVAIFEGKVACTHSCVYTYIYTFICIHVYVRAMRFVGRFVCCGRGEGSHG